MMIITVFPLPVPHHGATHVGMRHIGVEGFVRFIGTYGTVDESGVFVSAPELVGYDHTLTALQSQVFRTSLNPCFSVWVGEHGNELDPSYTPPEAQPVEPEEEPDV